MDRRTDEWGILADDMTRDLDPTGAVVRSAHSMDREVDVTNEIGNPRPQLEPQMTSLEKCKIT